MTSTPSATPSPSTFRSETTRRAGAGAGQLAAPLVLVVAAAYVYSRALHTWANYDEGVYAASLDALRHGQRLGSDVFASQPPGWYLVLRAIAFVSGDTLTALRTGLLVVSVGGVGAAYACGYAFGGIPAGVAAGGAVAIAPPYPLFAAQVEADPAAVAFMLVAVAFAAFAYRGIGRAPLAFAAGATLAFAISVKLLAVVGIVPVVALACVAEGPLRRRLVPLVAGFSLVTLAYVVAYASRLGAIWNQAFALHTSAYGERGWHSHTWNAHRIVSFLNTRVPATWIVVAAIAVTAALATGRRLDVRVGALWSLALAGVAFVIAIRPQFDHHLVLAAAALGLPAGSVLGYAVAHARRRVSAVVGASALALTLAAGFVQQAHRVTASVTAEPAEIDWAVRALRTRTEPRELVASDLPIVAYLAHRRLPGELVDTSYARFSAGSLTNRDVLSLLRRDDIRTVVAARAFVTDQRMARALRERFGAPVVHAGIRVYSR